ncbi:MAG: WD40 repeat domain-containing protein, partial [Gemmataceae bacterium]|nr:WD40 repeat domain-containing protein [Gemmataceae bacterium]
ATLSASATRALVPDSNAGFGVFDLATGVQQFLVPAGGDGRAQAALTPDGSKVVLTYSNAYDPKKQLSRVTVWDAGTSKKLGAVELPGYAQVAAAVTPDGKHLVTAGRKPNDKGAGEFLVTAWELPGGAKKGERTEAAGYSIPYVATAADNRTAAVVTSKGELIAFDLADGKRGKSFDLKGRNPGAAPVFSPDGKRLAVACQPGFGNTPTSPVLVFDWESGEVAHAFNSPGFTPQALTFSPDGKSLITGAPDTTATVWDVSK